MKTILLIASLLTTQMAMAEVYKCQNADGRMEFQSAPCANPKAGGAMNLKIKEDRTPAEVNTAGTNKARIESNEKIRNDVDNRLKRKSLTEDLERAQTQLRLYNNEMEAELEALRRSKGYSNNNLAGETRNVALSSEMTAVTTKYANKITMTKLDIERIQRQIDAIGK
jgi:Domain of unknown function (DUF4124)